MIGVNKKVIGDVNDFIFCLYEKVVRFSNSNILSVVVVIDLF